jgi:hypothetical protein
MRHTLLTAGLMILGTVLSGCAAGGRYGYSVRYGPPTPPRYGVMGVAPGPGYVWGEGYWDRRGNDWAWNQGHWMRPPRAHARWVAPHWEQHGHEWRLHQGRWR